MTAQATPNIKVLPRMIRGTSIQPIFSISGEVDARSAVAPAGGCIVLVMPMAADARPTERAPAIQRRFSKSEFSLNSLVMPTPITEEKT